MKLITTILFSLLSIGTFAQCDDFFEGWSILHPFCYGDSTGSIELGAFDGVEPYIYEIRNEDGDLMNDEGTNIANGLPAGEYSYYIIDDVGCELEDIIVLTSPDELRFVEFYGEHGEEGEDGEPRFSCNLIMVATGGVGDYTHLWVPLDDPDMDAVVPGVNFIEPGCYIGTITDENGCSISDTVCVGWLGIEDHISKQIDLVYSMSKNTVQINGDGLVHIKLYNINGQLLVEQTLQSGNNNIVNENLQPVMIYEVTAANGKQFTGKVDQIQP